ncbi:cell division protein FtsK [Solihabitans fulvus]|uniref:Cell division protein FtsK n=1 Tax=Solihabitans fulvus TaxID=1892852 RepID=A0A5B2XU08_9PSEU|nr:cell division protein FtsK [Solihabitans fulvus]KAA2266986.1 cell division protein FtsK [Solihabitans fulvus]
MTHPKLSVEDAPGKLVPFPGTADAPRSEVLTGELVDEAEYQRTRARRLAESMVSRLPAVWQTPETARQASAQLAGQLVALPVRYPGSVGRGLAVSARAWWSWVRVADFYAAARTADRLADRWLEIAAIRKRRAWWSLTAIGTAASGSLVTDLAAGPLPLLLTGGAVSAGLALLGRRKDGAGGRKAVVGPRTLAWAMDGDHLVEAFRDAKLIGRDEGLAFVRLPKRDGAGWYVVVDLPPSRRASNAVAHREDLASALAVDESRLIIERVRGDDGHAGRVSLWIGDSDPYAAMPVASPLASAEAWDLWTAPPFGSTARGGVVAVPVVWTSLLVGAIPRMGKTYVMRLPMTAAALDPHVRLIIADGKGGKDHRPFELVAHRFIRNTRPESVLRLIAVLEEAAADVENRFERLSDMDDEVCPESKVTPEITRNPTFGMPLTVIGIDEIQNYLEDDTPLDLDNPKSKKRGQRILELLTFIAKTGPAAGYSLVLATQKPDSAVIPDKLRGQLGTRFALKVMTWQASETILGAGTYKAGMDASKLLKSHKGVGLLLGADGETDLDAGEATAVRTHLLAIKEIRVACHRGRALREAAGTLSGDAAGNRAVGDLPPEVAARIADVTAAGVAAVEVEDAVLAEDLPEVLGLLVEVIEDHEAGLVATFELAGRIGWEAKALGEALRRAGVPAPVPPRQRINGSPHPVSVADLDAIRVAVIGHIDG